MLLSASNSLQQYGSVGMYTDYYVIVFYEFSNWKSFLARFWMNHCWICMSHDWLSAYTSFLPSAELLWYFSVIDTG